MAGRVDPVQGAAEDRDGPPPGIERSQMRLGIDPLREAAGDDDAAGRELGGEPAGDAGTSRSGPAASDNRDLGSGQHPGVAANEQHRRSVRDLPEPQRHLRIAGSDDLRSEGVETCEVPIRPVPGTLRGTGGRRTPGNARCREGPAPSLPGHRVRPGQREQGPFAFHALRVHAMSCSPRGVRGRNHTGRAAANRGVRPTRARDPP